MRSIPIQFDDGRSASLPIHRNLTVVRATPGQREVISAALPEGAVVLTAADLPPLDTEARSRAAADAEAALATAEELVEQRRLAAVDAAERRSGAELEVEHARRRHADALEKADAALEELDRLQARLDASRRRRHDATAAEARAGQAVEAAAAARAELAERMAAVPPVEDDPTVSDAQAAIQRSEAVMAQLQEVLAAGDLPQDVRAAIDDPRTRNQMLERYGFDSFLDYSIAISTGALAAYAGRTLELVGAQLDEQRLDLDRATTEAEARRAAQCGQMEADVERIERDAAAQAESCRDALVTAEREVLDAEQAVEAAREAHDRATSAVAAANEELDAAEAARAEAQREVHEATAELGFARDVLDACEARLRTAGSTALTATEIATQFDAVRAHCAEGDEARATLVVLLDAWHQLGEDNALALLDRVDDRELTARVVYVTDDETVLTWGRRLRRWRGVFVDLVTPERPRTLRLHRLARS